MPLEDQHLLSLVEVGAGLVRARGATVDRPYFERRAEGGYEYGGRPEIDIHHEADNVAVELANSDAGERALRLTWQAMPEQLRVRPVPMLRGPDTHEKRLLAGLFHHAAASAAAHVQAGPAAVLAVADLKSFLACYRSSSDG